MTTKLKPHTAYSREFKYLPLSRNFIAPLSHHKKSNKKLDHKTPFVGLIKKISYT